MIKREYKFMRICDDRIDFADVENTITYSLSPNNLQENLNKREELLCKKITDLEAKLAEKETRIAELEDKDWYEGTIKQLEEQNERLIKQLAEKDEEIESLKYTVDFYKSYYVSFREKVIDELEKVRNFAYDTYREFGVFDETDLEHILDNQIEELKKGLNK